jgi:Nuclear pore assembly and biogenesis
MQTELQDHLPTSFPSLSHLQHLSHLSTVSSYSSMVLSFINNLAAKIHALSLQLTGESVASPSLTTVALLLIILFLSLKILNMLYRTIVFWVKMIFRVAVLGAVVGTGSWIYVRGIDGVQQDVSDLVAYWSQEVKRYEAMGREGEAYLRKEFNR